MVPKLARGSQSTPRNGRIRTLDPQCLGTVFARGTVACCREGVGGGCGGRPWPCGYNDDGIPRRDMETSLGESRGVAAGGRIRAEPWAPAGVPAPALNFFLLSPVPPETSHSLADKASEIARCGRSPSPCLSPGPQPKALPVTAPGGPPALCPPRPARLLAFPEPTLPLHACLLLLKAVALPVTSCSLFPAR